MDKSSAEESFIDSIYSNTKVSRQILSDTGKDYMTNSCLMITGEIGTGKNHVAHLCYIKGIFKDNPLYVINCAMLNDKSWNFVVNDYHSPFTDNNNTIYISNLERLSPDRRKQLLSVILDTRVHVRNHMIFSCSESAEGRLTHSVLEYINALHCTPIYIKPLREQKQDIPSSASLYINTLNQSLGKEVVGLDDGAVRLLMEYDYPHNLLQFKRILEEAVLKTDTPYLSEETIQIILEREKTLYAKSNSDYRKKPQEETDYKINLNQSLDDMTLEIIQHTLKLCNGNHTLAAKRLKISRTTLWRYLNRQ